MQRTNPVLDVLALACEEVVHDIHNVALLHQDVHKVAAYEASAASDQDATLHGGRMRKQQIHSYGAG